MGRNTFLRVTLILHLSTPKVQRVPTTPNTIASMCHVKQSLHSNVNYILHDADLRFVFPQLSITSTHKTCISAPQRLRVKAMSTASSSCIGSWKMCARSPITGDTITSNPASSSPSTRYSTLWCAVNLFIKQGEIMWPGTGEESVMTLNVTVPMVQDLWWTCSTQDGHIYRCIWNYWQFDTRKQVAVMFDLLLTATTGRCWPFYLLKVILKYHFILRLSFTPFHNASIHTDDILKVNILILEW